MQWQMVFVDAKARQCSQCRRGDDVTRIAFSQLLPTHAEGSCFVFLAYVTLAAQVTNRRRGQATRLLHGSPFSLVSSLLAGFSFSYSEKYRLSCSFL
ncbi:hypothetical protein CEXT_435791 [Caerostris extrusa]|uniref:Uncharacterized protein n=1 Tax=Caerostris extrusa TaxID=172846 RepID=A0AAV4UPR8_CAEEX|nr:hypothetical protein CEXT_435791 [Caerostris extrusa]